MQCGHQKTRIVRYQTEDSVHMWQCHHPNFLRVVEQRQRDIFLASPGLYVLRFPIIIFSGKKGVENGYYSAEDNTCVLIGPTACYQMGR